MTNPKQNKDALGKGIRSLLQSIDSDLKNTSGGLKPQAVEAATGVLRIPIENITGRTGPVDPPARHHTTHHGFPPARQ
jgi:ParB family chromosome partitioning protein